MAYLEAKNGGQSDLEAILSGLLSSRRGATATAGTATGYGKGAGRDTTGEVDPGAAGAASMLEGLFGALLQSALRNQNQAPVPAQPAPSSQQPSTTSMILDVLGGLFRGR